MVFNHTHHFSFTANNVFHQYSENGFEAKSSVDINGSIPNCTHSDSSDSENESADKNSPKPRRRKSPQQPKLPNQSTERASNGHTNDTIDPNDDLAYVDTLPEEVKLVEVTSNLWGTKFKIHGLAKTVPANLGQVTYKTSFLHLQPRQMTLVITELRDDFPLHLKSMYAFIIDNVEKQILDLNFKIIFFFIQPRKWNRIKISIQMFSPKMKTNNRR